MYAWNSKNLYTFAAEIKNVDDMVTIKINDEPPFGKHIFGDLRQSKNELFLEEPSTAPPGYLTGDEFEKRCIKNITHFYNEKGLL